MRQFTHRPVTAKTITEEATSRVAATMQLGERRPDKQAKMVRKEAYKVRRERKRRSS